MMRESKLASVGLPRAVLEKFCNGNARRLIAFPGLELLLRNRGHDLWPQPLTSDHDKGADHDQEGDGCVAKPTATCNDNQRHTGSNPKRQE